MKIIFLDIDGVLNNMRTRETFEDYVFVDDNKILLLKQLIDKTNAKVVLSSSWRIGWQFKDKNPRCANDEVRLFEALQRKLKEFDIDMLSYTPHLWCRGKEIDTWLNEWQGEKVDSFVILDDMPKQEFEPNASHLVQTDISKGLTLHDIDQAIKILNEASSN